MEVAMVKTAKRDHIFVADLLREPTSLGKAQVMGVGRLAAADGAGQVSYLF